MASRIAGMLRLCTARVKARVDYDTLYATRLLKTAVPFHANEEAVSSR